MTCVVTKAESQVKGSKWAFAGRGVISLTSAFRLAQLGAEVHVYGPRSSESCTSTAAVGISAVKGLLPSNKAIFDANLQGHAYLRSLISELKGMGLESSVWKPGVMEIYRDLMDLGRLRKRVYHNNFSALYDCYTLAYDQLSNSYLDVSPHLRATRHQGEGFFIDENPWTSHQDLLVELVNKHPFLGALFYPSDYSFDPNSHLCNLEMAIQKLGGKVYDQVISHILTTSTASTASTGTESKAPRFKITVTDPTQTRMAKNPTSHSSRRMQDLEYTDVFLGVGQETNEFLRRNALPEIDLKYSQGSSFLVQTSLSNGAIKQGRDSLVVCDGQLRFGSIESKIEEPIPPPLLGQNDYFMNEGATVQSSLLRSHRQIKEVPDDLLEESNQDRDNPNIDFRRKQFAEKLLQNFGITAHLSCSMETYSETRRIRVKTSDQYPVYGSFCPFVDKPGYNLWIGTGFNKTGFVLSDYCARHLPHLISSGNEGLPFFEFASPSRVIKPEISPNI